MKYLLQIYAGTDEFVGLSEAEQNAVVGEYVAIRESPGVIGGDQLQPVETATTDARPGRRDASHRWSLRGCEGAPRRLLPRRG